MLRLVALACVLLLAPVVNAQTEIGPPPPPPVMPDEGFPAEAGSAYATPTPTPAPQSSTGGILAGVAGIVAVLAFIVLLVLAVLMPLFVFLCWREARACRVALEGLRTRPRA